MKESELMKDLESLVAKWRAEVGNPSSDYENGEKYGNEQCAKELEILIWNQWRIPLRKGAGQAQRHI